MTKHIKDNNEGQQGNANHSRNPGDRVVDKTAIIIAAIWVSLMIGSFLIKEIYWNNKVVDIMLGGINIAYFNFVVISIMVMIGTYFEIKIYKNINYMIKRILLYSFLLILGYILTIIFIRSVWALVIWLPIIYLIFLNAMVCGRSGDNDQSN